MIFNYLFLPVLIFIAGITAYQDLKYGKIKNKWIVLGLTYGVVVILIFFAWDLVADPISKFYYLKIKGLATDAPMPVFKVSLSYFKIIATNFLISVIVGFFMWRTRAWSAGDAKLFFVFALLLPLEYYSKSYLPFFPSFALLINIFIPIFIFFSIRAAIFFIRSLFRNNKKKIIYEIGEKIKNDWLNIVGLFIVFVLMFLFVRLLQQRLGDFFYILKIPVPFFVLILMFFVSRPLIKLLKNKYFLFSMIAAFLIILIYSLSFYPDYLLALLKQILFIVIIFMILIGLLRKVLDLYIQESGVKVVGLEELQTNHQVSQGFIQNLKDNREISSLLKRTDRLTPEGLVVFKQWCVKNGIREVRVYKSFPFAVWMVLGLLITLILKGSLISFALKLF